MSRSRRRRGGAGLQLCLACSSPFVAPIESIELGRGGRVLMLRCGECGVWRQAIAPPGAAQAFERALAEELEAISAAVERLDRERMVAQVDAFIAALHRDLFDAGDFR